MYGVILCVNLNPCLDKTVTIEGFKVGALNRVKPMRLDAAGKGINVAMAAKQLGMDVFSIGFNYSENGRQITNTLEKAGILNDMVMVLGALRTNLKIVDTLDQTYTEINEPGGFVPEEAVDDLLFRLRRRADQCNVVTLSGSVPPGVREDIFRCIIEELGAQGIRCVLDADGPPLKEGILAKPWMLKPNLNEMETLFGRAYQTEAEIIEDAKQLVQQGIGMVCVSMGALGAVLVSANGVYRAQALTELEAKGYQGAGDAMVAGLCLAAEQGLFEFDMLRYGMAAASAAILREGTQMCTLEEFERLLPQIEVEKLTV